MVVNSQNGSFYEKTMEKLINLFILTFIHVRICSNNNYTCMINIKLYY